MRRQAYLALCTTATGTVTRHASGHVRNFLEAILLENAAPRLDRWPVLQITTHGIFASNSLYCFLKSGKGMLIAPSM